MGIQRSKVYVIGVGMTKFYKPGKSNKDYPELAFEAVTNALNDARVTVNDIKSTCVGYVYGDSTCGQRAMYEVGMTGTPIYNVNNNCSTGSTALLMGKQIIESGNGDCVLALGFEKMEKGSLSAKYLDRTNPMDKHLTAMGDIAGFDSSPIFAQLFGNAGKEHMNKYGTKLEHLAKIAFKNHKNSKNNPNAQFRQEYSLEEIINSPQIFGPLTKLQCSPTSDGAAAAVLANEDFVISHGLQDKAVEILGMEMVTDLPSTFEDRSCIKIVGYDMTKTAAQNLYRNTGVTPKDIDVVELHDCFSANELITYEALGLCPEGKASEFIDSGNNTYGGTHVVNPSGGLISKGHPLGATGIAQCAELCWQLRGEAGPRQVDGAQLALQHNIGLGGAVVVALYTLGFPSQDNHNAMFMTRVSLVEDPAGFKSATVFNDLDKAMKEDKEGLIDKIQGVYCFKVKNIEGKEAIWILDAKNGSGSVKFNGKDKADVTFVMNDEDVIDLISGKLNPQKAFFQGKIKVTGNMGLAMKLSVLQKQAGKQMLDLKSKL